MYNRWVHTRRTHHALRCVDGHVLVVTKTAHPLVPIYEKISTLPISIGVEGVTNEPHDELLGTELYMPLNWEISVGW